MEQACGGGHGPPFQLLGLVAAGSSYPSGGFGLGEIHKEGLTWPCGIEAAFQILAYVRAECAHELQTLHPCDPSPGKPQVLEAYSLLLGLEP